MPPSMPGKARCEENFDSIKNCLQSMATIIRERDQYNIFTRWLTDIPLRFAVIQDL